MSSLKCGHQVDTVVQKWLPKALYQVSADTNLKGCYGTLSEENERTAASLTVINTVLQRTGFAKLYCFNDITQCG